MKTMVFFLLLVTARVIECYKNDTVATPQDMSEEFKLGIESLVANSQHERARPQLEIFITSPHFLPLITQCAHYHHDGI